MSTISSLARRVRSKFAELLRWLLPSLGRRPAIRVVISEGMLPSNLKERTLYVVTEDGVPWQAALICPCGCGENLDLNLLTDERPCWRVSVGPDGAASLAPSVWRTEGCRSHFFVREGEIVWAK